MTGVHADDPLKLRGYWTESQTNFCMMYTVSQKRRLYTLVHIFAIY